MGIAGFRPALVLAAAAIAACGGGTPTSPSTAPGPSTNPTSDTLRAAAMASGRRIGAAVQAGLLMDARYSDTVAREFNYLTAEYEMKWGAIEATRGVR